jgi:hypothetical protein
MFSAFNILYFLAAGPLNSLLNTWKFPDAQPAPPRGLFLNVDTRLLASVCVAQRVSGFGRHLSMPWSENL